jgi:hypothetical protein
MKTQTKYALTMLLCSFFMVSLLACSGTGDGSSGSIANAQNPPEASSARLDANPQNPLIGTWVSGGYSITFKPDNTYLRDFNLDGIPAVRGRVTVSGNVIIVTDSGSCGSYTYTMSGNTLTFSLFHDPCSERAAFLDLTYTKQ